MGASSVDPLGHQSSNGRGDDARFLVPHAAFFARVGVEASHRDARGGDAEIADHRHRRHPPAPFDQRGGEQARHF